MRGPSRYRVSIAVWSLLLAYASLYPFAPLREPSQEAIGGFFTHPRYVTDFDVALNVLAYVPLGALACLHFRQFGASPWTIAKAACLGFAFSFAMETAQLFIPSL